MRRGRWWLGGLLAAGLLVRLVIAWRAAPTGDLDAFLVAVHGFQRFGFRFYSHVNAFDPAAPFTYRAYSYPPGYLPWLWFSVRSGPPFWQVARVPPIVADVGLAWIVARELGRRGAQAGMRLAAAAAILAGPSFIASSAIEGQIDAVAIVPAVVAAIVWTRGDPGRRAMWAGLLIGTGAAIKTAPFLVVLALLPTAVSRREMVRLAGWAAAVPLALLMPFLALDPGGTISTLRYGGFPGAGGLGLVLQPGLAVHYLGDYDLSSANGLLQSAGWILTLGGVAVATLASMRGRLDPFAAGALLWLGVYATSINWYPQYLAWGLPFLLIAGYVWQTVAVQVSLAVTLSIAYRQRLPVWLVPGRGLSASLYVAVMDALWLAAGVAFVVLATKALHSGRQPNTARRVGEVRSESGAVPQL